MAFDLHLTFADNSSEAQILQHVAEVENITPQQAGQRLFVEAVKARLAGQLTPAQKLLGAFSAPQDIEIVDEAMATVHAHRATLATVRDFGC